MGGLQKQFLRLNKRPVLFYSLDAFAESNVAGVVIVVPEDKISYTRRLISGKYKHLPIDVIAGGKTRRFSSYNGIEFLRRTKQDCTFVIFHDGVRALISAGMVNAVISSAQTHGAAVLVSRGVNVMVHLEKSVVTAAHSPNAIFNTQTPHCYRLDWIAKAHESPVNRGHKRNAYENIELVLAIGKPIHGVDGFYRNTKLTFPQDVVSLSALVAAQKKNKNFLRLST